MNILLINHYAGSPRHGMEYRPYYLAREWVRLGHRVTTVAASYSHLRNQQPEAAACVTEEEIEGVHYFWLKTRPYSGNGVGRIVNIAGFVAALTRHRKHLALTDRPDLVIASSTYRFEAFPARWIAKKSGAQLVYEVRDLWPLTQIEIGGMSRWHPFVLLLRVAEDYAYRTADCVVSSLPNVEPYLRAHRMTTHRFAYIPNGIDVQQWQTQQTPLPEEHARAFQTHRDRGRLVVGYAGGHGLANGLDTLLEAAALLPAESVAVVLVGDGPEKARLQAKAAQLGLVGTQFLPSVPRSAVPSLLANMDVLYLGWPDRPIYQFGISPNKLMDYMMAGKPVVHAVKSANDPVAASGCGVCCLPEVPAASAEAVLGILGFPPAEREAMGQRGKDYVLRHHQYPMLAGQFLDVVSANERSKDHLS
jgi:glycosyltransferase involved in cell wall biosynthesis